MFYLKRLYFSVAIIIFSTCISENDNGKDIITVYSASGMRMVVEEVNKLYEDSYIGNIEPSYASSGTLARQIANGAVCDIFISANSHWINYLLKKDLLDKNSIDTVASTSLVAVAPLNSRIQRVCFDKTFEIGALKIDKIAVGHPGFVPVGQYTEVVFNNLGWAKELSNKLLVCNDVASVRRYVEMEECDFGIVYYSEAIQSDKIKIIGHVPSWLHGPIYFYLAAIKDATINDNSAYAQFYKEKRGAEIFKKFGFKKIED